MQPRPRKRQAVPVTRQPADVQTLVRDGSDGTLREYLFFDPGDACGLLILFHPFGFDPEAVIWGEEPGQRLIRPLEGMYQPAASLGLAVLAPRARGRELDGVSLAWPGHLADVRSVARECAGRVGGAIVCGGLSMGGLEALVFAGMFAADVAAAWAVNPVIDIAAWYGALSASPEVAKTEVADLISQELGGSPDQQSAAYASRTPLSYVDALARTRLLIAWTPNDGVIPNAALSHAGVLVDQVRRGGGWVDERITTCTPPTDEDAGRYAHESFDAWSVAAFTADELGRVSD